MARYSIRIKDVMENYYILNEENKPTTILDQSPLSEDNDTWDNPFNTNYESPFDKTYPTVDEVISTTWKDLFNFSYPKIPDYKIQSNRFHIQLPHRPGIDSHTHALHPAECICETAVHISIPSGKEPHSTQRQPAHSPRIPDHLKPPTALLDNLPGSPRLPAHVPGEDNDKYPALSLPHSG